ncbi:PhzF family phenazine biosynthesis protein [Clostridium oryzae]|uniref:Putative isomerase YddE n=1 Tax=Clostridium oryzae TaxID=1450648 RepID=A0A1V4IS81_9CLOT|nr:PhzF family phenazine biosynthesis protein [Clostridium oryzae]OPJ62749.1 putative isomerase YddE [Clostridium oryzae]
MKIKVYKLNAFAKNDEGGNGAGVVFNEYDISDKVKQSIAEEIGFSETAFIEKSEKADFKIRFFTPRAEVDLCGHATIGSFYLMKLLNIIHSGEYSEETKAGIMEIDVYEDGTIFMHQNLPEFYQQLDAERISKALGVDKNSIREDIPIQVVSTGLKDIIIPVKSINVLNEIKPNFNMISEISKAESTVGMHVFTMDTISDLDTAQCRNFAPLYDINEESATGTSNAALACYLYRHGLIEKHQAKSLVFEQGYVMGKPSEIKARLSFRGDNIKSVEVGGIAGNITESYIEI